MLPMATAANAVPHCTLLAMVHSLLLSIYIGDLKLTLPPHLPMVLDVAMVLEMLDRLAM